MNLAIGSDHVGYPLKTEAIDYLTENNLVFTDFGTFTNKSTHYPIFARDVGLAIAQNKFDAGLLFCGTGVGMCIAVNRIRRIRAVVCSEAYSAKMARAHNDANVLCLGSRVVGVGLAKEIIDVFLSTKFDSGRHDHRIKMLESYFED
jgi:ribose 5-phosphate isomerase B